MPVRRGFQRSPDDWTSLRRGARAIGGGSRQSSPWLDRAIGIANQRAISEWSKPAPQIYLNCNWPGCW